MESSILKKAGKSLSEQKKRRHWKGIVAVLAVVVMLGTALALSFPALTQGKQSRRFWGTSMQMHVIQKPKRFHAPRKKTAGTSMATAAIP